MVAQGWDTTRGALDVLGPFQISTTMNIYTRIAAEPQKEAVQKVADALWPAIDDGLMLKVYQENIGVV
jgi:hypothetical protein